MAKKVRPIIVHKEYVLIELNNNQYCKIKLEDVKKYEADE